MIVRLYLLSMVLSAAVLAGCQSADDLPAVDAPTPEAAAVPPEEPTHTPSKPNEPELAAASDEQSSAADQFTPPFPDRLELFEPPKRAQSTVRRDDEHGETVELKGFINVDAPRVVLSIDGVISPIPEGGEKYGVQVISIQPPSVVLQRGRNRWTATLE